MRWTFPSAVRGAGGQPLNRLSVTRGQSGVNPKLRWRSDSLRSEMSGLSKLNPMARHRAHCAHVRAQMSDYLDSDLDEQSARAIERHVRWCPNCRHMLKNLRRTIDGLNALGTLGPRSEAGITGP